MAAGRSQREFFDSQADAWEAACYPRKVRERLAALIPEFRLRPGVIPMKRVERSVVRLDVEVPNVFKFSWQEKKS